MFGVGNPQEAVWKQPQRHRFERTECLQKHQFKTLRHIFTFDKVSTYWVETYEGSTCGRTLAKNILRVVKEDITLGRCVGKTRCHDCARVTQVSEQLTQRRLLYLLTNHRFGQHHSR